MIFQQTVDARADPEADEAAVGGRGEDAAVGRAFSIASVDDATRRRNTNRNKYSQNDE